MAQSKLFDWIGGKKWLSDKLTDECKKIIETQKIKYYIEPFCGSLGSLLGSLKLFERGGIEKIILNDINKNLINTFICVKNSPNQLFEKYKEIELKHVEKIPDQAFSLHKTRDKSILKQLMAEANTYYNQTRTDFNSIKNSDEPEDILLSSAQFLFLMSRAFNGVYRENSSGRFNSPYGWTNKKLNLDNKLCTILEWSQIFNQRNVEFYNLSFEDFLDKVKVLKSQSLFYFDPPYLNETIKENGYNKDFFDINKQNLLLNYIGNLDYIIYSNHDLKIFREFFVESKYSVKTFYRKNIMSSDNSNRNNDVAEILVTTKI